MFFKLYPWKWFIKMVGKSQRVMRCRHIHQKSMIGSGSSCSIPLLDPLIEPSPWIFSIRSETWGPTYKKKIWLPNSHFSSSKASRQRSRSKNDFLLLEKRFSRRNKDLILIFQVDYWSKLRQRNMCPFNYWQVLSKRCLRLHCNLSRSPRHISTSIR